MAIPAPTVRLGSRILLLGISVIALAGLASASWFRVRQNEVAYVARFGQVVNPTAGPLQAGLHFELPLADEADTLSISTDTVKMPVMKAFTRDTQEVTLQLSLTYNVPPASAYHLLYEVGRAGNVDIAHNLKSIANDRVRSIVSRRDVTDLAGEGREKIMEEIKAAIAAELKRLFKVEVQDVQIPTLDFSTQYKEAVNRATLARAQRVQAEQDRERAKVEAETVIVKAKGEANSQYARAEGSARAQLIKPEPRQRPRSCAAKLMQRPCEPRSRLPAVWRDTLASFRRRRVELEGHRASNHGCQQWSIPALQLDEKGR